MNDTFVLLGHYAAV